ncbi:hypothetical protein DFH06DRAFT_1128441 [Mycena polygramma]|nr:hypothetical protein DFH06DRAFT_1128441 [Mycena polygramma]
MRKPVTRQNIADREQHFFRQERQKEWWGEHITYLRIPNHDQQFNLPRDSYILRNPGKCHRKIPAIVLRSRAGHVSKMTTKPVPSSGRRCTKEGVHFSWCSFLGNQEKIAINGSPALAGRENLVFFDLFGPPKSDVTVTNTKSVQFRCLRHASLEHSVEIVQYSLQSSKYRILGFSLSPVSGIACTAFKEFMLAQCTELPAGG